jgi:hypothetical protein
MFEANCTISARHIFLACIVGLLVSCAIALKSPDRGTDFHQFYSAATVSGSGDLYNWERLSEVQEDLGRKTTPYGRLPVYAAAFRMFTALDYPVARVAWLIANLLAIAGFVLLWPFSYRLYAVLALCWSYPLAILFATGQDTPFFLLSLAGGMRLLSARREGLAGLVFSLAAIKFHLAVTLPVLLIARRSWKALFGGIAGCAVLLAASFAIEGRDWFGALQALSKVPEFSPAPYKMPNLHGLAYWAPFSSLLEVLLAAISLTAVYRLARNAPLKVSAAAMLAGGLLVSHHAYVYDAVLLIPLLLVIDESSVPQWMKYWALLLLTPIPYMLLLQQVSSAGAQVAITGLSILAIVVFARRKTLASPTDPAGRPLHALVSM